MQNNNVTIKYEYNRLELVLLSSSEYDLMDFQPYKNKNLYLVNSCEFIIYNKNPTEAQKIKLIENIVTKKIIVSNEDSGYFDDYYFDDYTLRDRDIVLFNLLCVKTGEEHIAIPFVTEKDCDKKKQFGYLRDGTILNINDTKKYMDVQLEKERIKNLESIAIATYSTGGGLFNHWEMYSFLRDYFGSPQTVKEVKDKFRELAKVYHPDVGGEELMFQAIANGKQYLIDALEHEKASYLFWLNTTGLANIFITIGVIK